MQLLPLILQNGQMLPSHTIHLIVGVLDLLVGFSTEVISSDRGRYKNINRQNVETFIDIKTIEEKVNKIIENNIELERECLDRFLKNEEPF